MIMLHLEAESLDDLRRQAILALGLTPGVEPADKPFKAYKPREPLTPERVAENAAKSEEILAASKPKKKPKDVKKTHVLEGEEPDLGDIVRGVAEEPYEVDIDPAGGNPHTDDALEQGFRDAANDVGNGAAPADPVAAEKLKQNVIDQLAGLFAAGKVKVVRHVLDKYGQGAKSFPEIDASQFPEIAAAIARGETA